MWNKLKIIILSRINKPKEDEEVLRKRSICKKCDFNSLNMEKIPFNKLLLKKLSDFYSWMAGKKDEDNLHNCEACMSCSIYYKTLYEDHCPHPEGDKWNN